MDNAGRVEYNPGHPQTVVGDWLSRQLYPLPLTSVSELMRPPRAVTALPPGSVIPASPARTRPRENAALPFSLRRGALRRAPREVRAP